MVRDLKVNRLVWALVMFTFMFVVISLFSVNYTRHVQQQADTRWCELFKTLDAPTPTTTTARGKQTQQQIHKLRVDLGCALK